MGWKNFRTYGFVISAIGVIAYLVWKREDAAIIQAASAAGSVVAAIFTAMAAYAALQAAKQSNLTSDHAREALARTLKPTVHANVVEVDPGKAIGTYGPGSDRGIVDVKVTWHLRDGSRRVERFDALTPEPTGQNPHLPCRIDLGPWRGSEEATAAKVVIEYADVSRLMRWRFTRRFWTAQEWIDEGYQPRMPMQLVYMDTDEPIR